MVHSGENSKEPQANIYCCLCRYFCSMERKCCIYKLLLWSRSNNSIQGVAVVSYYLTLVLDTVGVTDPDTQTLINGLLQIFNFIAAGSAALLVDRLGRRTLFLCSAVGMLVSFIVWTACSAVFSTPQAEGLGRTVIAFVFIFFFHYDIAVVVTRKYYLCCNIKKCS
jgi:MFS family permease